MTEKPLPPTLPGYDTLREGVVELLESERRLAARSVNVLMTATEFPSENTSTEPVGAASSRDTVWSRLEAAPTDRGFRMGTTYCEIGRRIVEAEQGGKERAEYGERLIARLAQDRLV